MLGGIVCVAVILIFFLGFKVIGKASKLDNDIKRQKRLLKEVVQVATEYSQIEKRSGQLKAKVRKGAPLLSYVEGLSRRAGIQNADLNPRRTQQNDYFDETSVELKAKELNLDQLTKLLQYLESSPRFLRIKYFQVKTPYSKKDLLNVTLQVSAYSPKSIEDAPPPEEESP